jgi:hypothetical protein
MLAFQTSEQGANEAELVGPLGRANSPWAGTLQILVGGEVLSYPHTIVTIREVYWTSSSNRL